MVEARHNSELQAETSWQAQMTPKQVIFESGTSLLIYSTWKHTVFISYPFEPSTVQHCQLMIHSPENKTMFPPPAPRFCKNPSIQLNVLAKNMYFFLSPRCFICFCSSDHKTHPPGLFRQQQQALPEDVLSQHAIMDFLCTFPGALLYSKLSCSVTLVQELIPSPWPSALHPWLPAEHAHPG